MAQGALAISKNPKGFTLSFIGSINKGVTEYKNFGRTGLKSKDIFPWEDLRRFF